MVLDDSLLRDVIDTWKARRPTEHLTQVHFEKCLCTRFRMPSSNGGEMFHSGDLGEESLPSNPLPRDAFLALATQVSPTSRRGSSELAAATVSASGVGNTVGRAFFGEGELWASSLSPLLYDLPLRNEVLEACALLRSLFPGAHSRVSAEVLAPCSFIAAEFLAGEAAWEVSVSDVSRPLFSRVGSDFNGVTGTAAVSAVPIRDFMSRKRASARSDRLSHDDRLVTTVLISFIASDLKVMFSACGADSFASAEPSGTAWLTAGLSGSSTTI